MLLPTVPSSREEVTLPWLQEALKQQPFDILSFSWEGQVGGGIGALSTLERLSLQIKRNKQVSTLSLVLKTPPSSSNPGLRDFVLNEGFCQREYKIYTKLFPAWRKFQDARGTPKPFRFRYPTCYYAAEEGSGLSYRNILLLEDMVASGYSSWEKGYRKGLRWSQAKKVVKEMALFHAVGMAYKEHMDLKHYAGEEFDFLFTRSQNEELISTFLHSGISSTCDMLRKSGEIIPPGLISDLESFQDLEKLQDLSFPRGDRAGTVTHQDLHIHNVMFNNETSSVALLDFQGCSYASPMADLTFFLLLCCDPAIYRDHLTEVLAYYAHTFEEAIEAMDSCVKYGYQEVLEDYHGNLFVSLIHIVMGSGSWCFGPFTSEDTKARYTTALLDCYARLGNSLGIERVEQFARYFEEHETGISEE